ncbi:sigma 54-interacting transcriptional regulator [Clostridium sp. HV4-5-A1G]|uniref:sigma 54-interacting transcriptional regulator n=1 Tax=Clostridium sp. HV4-5-A1G TaxID=2004595 RepID=UPI00123A33B0|nr:sigma 54-interacting transcriptional regulator [Clostridium sp. HV4-5-A1G]KAA8674945.1 PAS domain S-box protein [Clostridium sp. HV4-5-A1G]
MSSKKVNNKIKIKQSPDGIVFTDNHFIIKYFNPAAEQLTGIKKDKALGKCFFDVFPQMQPSDDVLNENKINRILINGKSLCIRNFENRDERGYTQGNRVFIMYDYYEALALITDLEKTEYVINELQEIIEGSFDGILVTDGEANVLLVNQSYVRITDIKKEELIGHNMRELINPIWMKNSVALLVIEQKKPISLYHTTKRGKNIMVTGTPVFDEKNDIKKVVINCRDISEIYKLRDQLSKAREMEKIYFQQDPDDDEHNANKNSDIVVNDEKMREIFSLAKKISNFNITVLISGESGVGKEIVANYVHRKNALKKDKPFIAVNCGAIPENLLESELFGYVNGAFTGAAKGGKAGLFEAADGGTLFLDEIGEMSLKLQVKLLRVLETRTVRRVGSSHPLSIDIRVIAATNKNLLEKVKEGTFREDLFFRLNVISIEIPPLRERTSDIAPLALKFIRKFNRQYGQNKKITYEVMKELEAYSWPGNIRQLKNTIESMVVISDNEYLQLNDLPWISCEAIEAKAKKNNPPSLKESLERAEKKILIEVKRKYGSSRKMAKVLKVNQSTIVRKMKKYNL